MPEESKKDAGEKKAQKVAAPPKPVGVEEKKVTLSGEKTAVVNPATRAASVSIPTGETDENGNVVFDTFEAGESYKVSAEALEVKNSEGINLLAEAE